MDSFWPNFSHGASGLITLFVRQLDSLDFHLDNFARRLCLTFVGAEVVIKKLAAPHYLHVLRVVWRNAIVLAHTIRILPILFLVYPIRLDWSIAGLIPGLFMLSGSVFVIVYFLGMLSSMFRDLPPIVNSIFVVSVYITPVMRALTLINDRDFSHL